MTNTKPLTASTIRTINTLAARGGVDALLDFRSTMTKAVARYEAIVSETPDARGASMAREGIRTGVQRIEAIDRKLAELTR